MLSTLNVDTRVYLFDKSEESLKVGLMFELSLQNSTSLLSGYKTLNIFLILGHRLQHWSNIKTGLLQRFVFSGLDSLVM